MRLAVTVPKAGRLPQQLCASKLAGWVRKAAGLKDLRVDPNHAWRHTFKTVGLGAGISEAHLDVICGHAPERVGRRYIHPPLNQLAAAISRFPRYDLA